LQFLICNKPAWWTVKPPIIKDDKECKKGEINEKALAWASDLLGLDCNGGKT